MAPQYAPSLRSRLAPLLLFLQMGFIAIYVFYVEIDTHTDLTRDFYATFQDVQVIVFLGFGFLGSFLVRYGFSSIGFNLLVAAVATQWAIVLNGMESWYYRGKPVLGKTNPVQLTLAALLEVTGFILNEWLLRSLLRVQLLNSIMQLHIFGPFFGLALTWILDWKGCEKQFEKEKSAYKSGLFSMLGSVFIWMFWPSFNSILVDDRTPVRALEAVLSTYLALAASAVTAAAVTVLSNPKGALNLIQMHSCIHAGGVAIGVCLTAVRHPWEAMTVGYSAAVLSTAGFRYLKVWISIDETKESMACSPHDAQVNLIFQGPMLLAHWFHDARDVLSTHAIPGLLGWVAHLLLQIQACDDPATAVRFAVFHMCTLFLTLALSLSMGLVTGKSCTWEALATISLRHSAAMEDRDVECTQQHCLFLTVNALHVCSKGSYSSGTFGDHPRTRNVLMIRLSGSFPILQCASNFRGKRQVLMWRDCDKNTEKNIKAQEASCVILFNATTGSESSLDVTQAVEYTLSPVNTPPMLVGSEVLPFTPDIEFR
ncbi:hypothetical protein fugu_016737 [Takifugu bimaculatus]|uniref:Ammonium transporter AmtB-like domain-containing protein n=1 Tax=Takifugu bimaculatus TaxID=433685 RepID=A0A4Z2BTU3_9TELE|nr:hypothetical protein fugu_016737 [Takifugu bimaculatus]